MAVFRDEEVLGLQVPVNDPLLVSGREALGDLEGVVQGLLLGDGPGVERSAQRLAFQKLHDGVGDAVLRSEVEDREDVRVGKGRDRQGLALEPRQGLRVRCQRLRQYLDRHVAL